MKIGDKITAIVNGGIARALLFSTPRIPQHVWNVRVFRARKSRADSLYPLKGTWPVDLSPDREGVTWALGWDGEAPGALRALVALERNK